MIPMSCPSCGRRGNVPLDRLNTRMHCKKCDAVFYLDATGKPVLGEPPSSRGGKGGKAGKKARPDNEPLDPIGIVAEKISELPRAVWYTLGGLVLLGAAYVGFMNMKPPALSNEERLLMKMNVVARAFIDKDMNTLNDMASGGSQGEVAKWVETFRPRVGDNGTGTSENIMVSLVPPSELVTDVPLDAQASLIAPSPGGDAPAPPPYILHLAMIYLEGKWYLDGKTTLLKCEEAEALKKKKK